MLGRRGGGGDGGGGGQGRHFTLPSTSTYLPQGGGGDGGGGDGGGGGQGRQNDLPSTRTYLPQGGGDGGGGDGGGGQSHFTGSPLSMFRRSSIGKSGSPIHWSGVRGSGCAGWGQG